jgi:phosphatidate cytidylyltransferase
MAAGLLGSLLLAAVLRLPWVNVLPAAQFGWGATAAFGLLVGFSGMMGDLSESLLKRSAGVKDSGETLPGYGGVLDVVDSLMVAGPVAYFLVRAILAWG